jgi:hypothetical protein
MRENTRCDVDEPMSTPTLSTTISSSSTSERPVLEKNTRPPTASSVIRSMLRYLNRHSGARAKPASPESITTPVWKWHRHSGLAATRRPGMTEIIYAPTNFGTTVPFL